VDVFRRGILSVMEDKKGKRCCLRTTSKTWMFSGGDFCL